jgi:hypothetical protein
MKPISLLNLAMVSAAIGIVTIGCTPKVYVIDRQTVLEDEAAGEWPQFEKDLLPKSAARSPTPFSKTKTTAHKAKLYNILNGELVSENAAAPLPEAAAPGRMRSTPKSAEPKK